MNVSVKLGQERIWIRIDFVFKCNFSHHKNTKVNVRVSEFYIEKHFDDVLVSVQNGTLGDPYFIVVLLCFLVSYVLCLS